MSFINATYRYFDTYAGRQGGFTGRKIVSIGCRLIRLPRTNNVRFPLPQQRRKSSRAIL